MRSTNVTILIALLALTCANAFDLASFVELGELKNDPYGKSLIQTISMTMEKKGGKIESIQGLLDELYSKLVQDQKRSTHLWRKEKKRLDRKIAQLKNIIAKLVSEIAGLKKSLHNYERLKRRSERNLRQYRRQKVDNVNSLNNLKKRRVSDKALYRRRLRESSAIIGALSRVIFSLKKLQGTIRGIHHKSHVRAEGAFAELSSDKEISAFLELATEVDQHALRQLISILRSIRHGFKVSISLDERYEERSKKTYKKLVLSLRADVASLDAAIKKQIARLNRFVKKINELRITIKIRIDLLKSRRAERKANIQERRTKEAKYLRDRAHRRREKKVIRRVQKIVNERLSRMNSFLKSKVNN